VLVLQFTDVKYKILIKSVTSTNEKYILNGISGYASPGQVVAMMGPSGCGKTTLLSILGGRTGNNAVEGSVTYNDETYNKSLKRRYAINKFVNRLTFILDHILNYFSSKLMIVFTV
jgi:ABC-type multidrug transport system ATPase subunit